MSRSLNDAEGPRKPTQTEPLGDIQQEIQIYLQKSKKDTDAVVATKILARLIQLEALPEVKDAKNFVIKPKAVHEIFWKQKPSFWNKKEEGSIIGWRNRALIAATATPKSLPDSTPQYRTTTQPYYQTEGTLTTFCAQSVSIKNKKLAESQNKRDYEFIIGNHLASTLDTLEGATKLFNLFTSVIEQIERGSDPSNKGALAGHGLRVELENGRPKVLISNQAFTAIFNATNKLTILPAATLETKHLPPAAMTANVARSVPASTAPPLYTLPIMAPAAATASQTETKSSPPPIVTSSVPSAVTIPAVSVPTPIATNISSSQETKSALPAVSAYAPPTVPVPAAASSVGTDIYSSALTVYIEDYTDPNTIKFFTVDVPPCYTFQAIKQNIQQCLKGRKIPHQEIPLEYQVLQSPTASEPFDNNLTLVAANIKQAQTLHLRQSPQPSFSIISPPLPLGFTPAHMNVFFKGSCPATNPTQGLNPVVQSSPFRR